LCKDLGSKKYDCEDAKFAELAITLRDCALDWYMILDANSAPRMTRTLEEIKKLPINEFQKLSSEDQYMNDMIKIR
jgi:hypothetical protein